LNVLRQPTQELDQAIDAIWMQIAKT